ncbi:MAG: ATP-dependent helicase [Candidatus Gastranaerophilales bacterium]|nr:ATP-dependent helicase [Candidatus Gastranaerophilales bacterium]
MLIQGNIRSEKSKLLQQQYAELINKGVLPENILVLTLNSYKKQEFINGVMKQIQGFLYGNPKIQTFYGLCYNALLGSWAEIEDSLKIANPVIIPNLCGLELSRLFLSDSIKNGIFQDYFSKNNLLHQMFKRIQLIVLNSLTEKEISEKSHILNETFYEDTRTAYKNYQKLTLQYRSFDYLRQLSILPYVAEHTDYFKNIEYLFVDDADEMTFAEFNFVKFLRPQLKDWFIAYDNSGSSRCGYLSAYKTAVFEFEKLFGEKADNLKQDDDISKEADKVYSNIINKTKSSPENFELHSYLKRLDMLDAAFTQINTMLKNGVKPSDIAVITPVNDDMLSNSLKRFFGKNITFQSLSGSKKPSDCVFLRDIFSIIKLLHSEWKMPLEASEYRSIFSNCLKIPVKYSGKAVSKCTADENLADFDFKNDLFNGRYSEFRQFVQDFDKTQKFSDEILSIFGYVSRNGVNKDDLKNFNFFLKEIRSFEKAFGILSGDLKKRILLQFQNGIISENPSIPEQIEKNAIIISTPQKIIDFEIKRKYQIWLDVSNDLWSMRDIGVLYNAWVFNAEWQNKEFLIEDNIRLANEKQARVLRKLFLCCQEKIYAYFSQYDTSGQENIGLIQSYFSSDEKESADNKQKRIIPRDDQKQVIEYRKGKGAVNAVPGAGKTTVLTALLVNLIESGVKPSNIYVLTYMESAATNIREKIKKTLPDLTDIPNISTIHGLAFKIIKENNNYVKLNLSDNLEVADDNMRNKILCDSISELGMDYDKLDDYKVGLSAVKLSPNGIKPLKYLKGGKDFDKLYETYEKNLKKAGVIDYDDMLRYAVYLVENFDEIREFYAESCEYIFEDEAQDSSELQQKLLLMLSEKHGNLLRIGDINQAITSSFTDSDPKCFKKYFDENIKMVMKSSQRSTVQIQKLANDLIDTSKTDENLKEAFFDSKLVPTGKNPVSSHVPEFRIFSDFTDEKYFVLNKIRDLNKKNKQEIAILVRNNSQITQWSDFLSQNGLFVTTNSDVLEQKSVFKVIIAFLEYFQTPFSKDKILNIIKTLEECRLARFFKYEKEYLKNQKGYFLSSVPDEYGENLAQLWWDLQFYEDLSYSNPDEIALNIGIKYFHTQNEKSNIYLIATIIRKLSQMYVNRNTVLDRLKSIAKRPVGSTFRFFEDENDANSAAVKIMTMHKSKGGEFDVVFIPELTEENYAVLNNKIKLKSNFAESVKELRNGYKKRTNDEIKTEIAEETMRLLYVGITRAKKELYISCSKFYNKKLQTPSVLFDYFGGGRCSQ